MATKKRKKKSAPRRRRRASMGAAPQFDIMGTLMAAGGGIVGEIIGDILPSTIDPKMVNGGKILVGAALPMLSKDAKTKSMLSDIGKGLATAGAIGLAKDLGFFSGIDDPDEVEDLAVVIEKKPGEISEDVLGQFDDYQDLSVINADVLGEDDLSVVNGMKDDDLD